MSQTWDAPKYFKKNQIAAIFGGKQKRKNAAESHDGRFYIRA